VRMPLTRPIEAVAPVASPASVVPWPHQLEAIAALREWDGRRGALIMPPGSGKTMVMGLWGRDVARVVVCSPTRALAAQTLEAMGRVMHQHRRLLVDSDSEGTRDASEIAAALAVDAPLLISTTYASMCDVMVGLIGDDAVLMVDEGHHLSTDAGLRAATAGLGCRVLVVTGTPPAALLEDDDDEDADPIVYQYAYDRAVRDRRICDYRIYLPLIQDPVGDRDHDELIVALGADLVSRCHFLANGMLRTGATRCIIYAGSVDEANKYQVAIARLAAKFHGIPVWCGMITGETPNALRDLKLKAFQKPDPTYRWFFMCSVRVLDEGIDVPACDAVYISQSIGNQSRFVQRMCRANRLDYSGKVANVFVWSDDVELDATLRATARVASTLSSADRSMHVERMSTDYAGALATVADADLAERVCIMCATPAEKWRLRLQQVDSFLVTFGRRPGQRSKDPDEKRLSCWMRHQAENYAADPAESKHILRNVDVHSEWTTLVERHATLLASPQELWRQSAAEAEAMMRLTGRRPNRRSSNPDEKRISQWIGTQLKNYADDPATSKYIMSDISIHAEWTALVERHAALLESPKELWRRSAAEAEAMMIRTGKRPNRRSSDPDEKRISMWIGNQLRTHAADPATSKLIMRDIEIHAEWAALFGRHAALLEPPEDAWRRTAAEAEAMMRATGRRPSQKSSDENEKRIGVWINNQLQNHADDPATSKWIMRQVDIHTEWTALFGRHTALLESPKDAWRRSAAEADAMMRVTGRRPSKTRSSDEKRIAEWINTQLKNYAADPARSKQLMCDIVIHTEWVALVGRHAALFESSQEAWQRSAAEADAMMCATGRRPSVKSSDPVEKRLASWINNQIVNHAVDPATSKWIMRQVDIHAEWVALIGKHAALLKKAKPTGDFSSH